jgi:hypothetical protein
MVQKFRCAKPPYSEAELIGSVAKDWHPLGFANLGGGAWDPCGADREAVCKIRDWNEATSTYRKKFGSRAFLFPNMSIGALTDRLLIEFSDPEREYIPDIGQDSGKE